MLERIEQVVKGQPRSCARCGVGLSNKHRITGAEARLFAAIFDLGGRCVACVVAWGDANGYMAATGK